MTLVCINGINSSTSWADQLSASINSNGSIYLAEGGTPNGYGSSADMYIGLLDKGWPLSNEWYRSYIWFDVSSFPSDGIVDTAYIDMIAGSTSSNNYGIMIFSLFDPQTLADWNNLTIDEQYASLTSLNDVFVNNILGSASSSSNNGYDSSGVHDLTSIARFGSYYGVALRENPEQTDYFGPDDTSRVRWNTVDLTINYANAPSPVSPTGNISTLTPTLTWNGSVTGLTYCRFHVQIASDSSFDSIIWEASNLTVTEITVPSGELQWGKDYFWHVFVDSPRTLWTAGPASYLSISTDDTFEDNDSFSGASTITVGTTSSLMALDSDWYKIYVGAGNKLTVTTTNDVTHYIYDSNEQSLATSSPSGSDQISNYDVNTSDDYYIYVPYYSIYGNSTSYDLTVAVSQPPQCSSNSDCGTDGWVYSPYCSNDDVWQDYRTYTCSNPGTSSATCSQSDQPKLKQNCADTCSSGQCVNVSCNSNSDCGTDDWVNSPYCSNDNVWQDYRTYTCSNPGTPSASCSQSDQAQQKQTCADTCSNGQCVTIACSSKSDCGTDGLVGSPYCSNSDVWQDWRTYVCNNPGTISASCSNIDNPQLIEDCTNICVNGQCATLPCQVTYSCPNGESCTDNNDCISRWCLNDVCTAPSCTDGYSNGDETDVDCGGSCAKCDEGKSCIVGSDCLLGVCQYKICKYDSCQNGRVDGSESDVDCGGACPNGCTTGQSCRTGNDCSSGLLCVDEICSVPPQTPSVPTNLSASDGTYVDKIQIIWTDNSNNEDGFRVYRSPSQTGVYSQVGTVGVNSTSYDDSQSCNGSTYWYLVRAYNAGGESSDSNVDSGYTQTCPATLTSIIISGATQVNEGASTQLTCTANYDDGSNQNVTSSCIWSIISGSSYGSVNSSGLFTGKSVTTDQPVTVQATYEGKSDTHIVTVKDVPAIPSVPTNVSASDGTYVDKIQITWTDNSNNEDGFRVYRSTSQSSTYSQIGTVGVNGTSYDDNQSCNGSTYWYLVRAFNAGGESADSNKESGLTASCQFTTIYVEPNGSCSTKTPCYTTIQDGINASMDGTTIKVAKDIYYENISVTSSTIGLRVQGGWSNDFLVWEEDPYLTVVDGNANGSVFMIDPSDNGSIEITIEGFTIQNGSGTFAGGGGIEVLARNQGSSTTAVIVNNVIRRNNDDSAGGGGGVFVAAQYPESQATVSMRKNIIDGNRSNGDGGGIWAGTFTSGSLDLALINNTITNNNAGSDGGGLYVYSFNGLTTKLTLMNNTITNNSGGQADGIYAYSWGDSGNIDITVNNSIIWGNLPVDIKLVSTGNTTSNLDAFYSDIGQVGSPGNVFLDSTTINQDPVFVDPTGGDYHLTVGSPCIDKATSVGAPSTDYDGDIVPYDGDGDGQATVDIGSDEYVGPPPAIINYYCDNDNDGHINSSIDGSCSGQGCEPSGCQTASGDDCNDGDNTIYTGTPELCDNVDNDCDGTVDGQTRGSTCGVGACAGNTGTETCISGTWVNDSCDPFADASMEVCDQLDNDCDGGVDEGVTNACGNCGAPTAEICDGKDNDCDGEIDEGVDSNFDSDSDTVKDCFDNCIFVSNVDQSDLDEDEIGDDCDDDVDGDGMSNEEEGYAGIGVESPDSNGDGILDYMDVKTTYFECDDGSGKMVLLVSDGQLEGCTILDESTMGTIGKPDNINFPYGFIQFTISGLMPYAAVDITLIMPEDLAVDAQYWKYDWTGYYQVPNTVVNGREISFTLTDDDGDGIILDPAAVGVPEPIITSSSSSSSSSSSGGCSVNQSGYLISINWLLFLLIPLWIRIRIMRRKR